MEEITPEQKAYLETFAGKRDAALLEISNLQIKKENLEKEVKDLVTSYSDTEARMNQVIGRIEELIKKEAELPLLLSRDVAQLESRKTCLETEIVNLTSLVEVLNSQKASLENDVSSALATFNAIKNEALNLNYIVDHVVKVSEANIAKVDNAVNDLARGLEEIIAVNKKNVFETNVVIEKLPKMLVEAQRHGLIRNKI